MAFRDLRGFLAALDAAGELHRVAAEVDPELEIAAVTGRHCKAPGGGRALLFERVRGSAVPVATNLFGSAARMALALGVAGLGELTGRSAPLFASPALAVPPVSVPAAPCREVTIERGGLGRFPFLKSWPGEEGRFITLPLVFTRDLATGEVNCGMYRVRIFDDATAGLRWKPGSGGFAHYRGYAEAGVPMPVAIALGADPVLTLAASLPLPDSFDELSFAGYLRGEPVEITPSLFPGLSVPARAELVIEGYLEPGAFAAEGPFGNHTGSYHPGEQVPMLRVERITHRKDPILQATVVGAPPMEDCWMARAAERILLPLVTRLCPEVVDILMPMEGIFHGCAVVSIRKTFPGQGRKVLESLREGSWLRRGKLLVVVDAGEREATWAELFWRALNGVRFPDDLVAGEGVLGVDATRKLPAEGGDGAPGLVADPAVARLVERRWREYGF
ncbi:UbiD family decarboxylase [Geomonas sp. Red32]|uniref:UbiD family decarboxylase n=1 Tax=Geomonas sp. Red32 TaxID=2912856 RepID=UPI00202CF627|nr:UbiD family decarboxylase [Geomonas sp. Red32]MCM0080462.1 UbiD family decarboxylase [Geomonas sp. Red32]